MHSKEFQGIYEIFDGEMSSCKGADCSFTCCCEKTISDFAGKNHVFNTVFQSHEEMEYWFSSLREVGKMKDFGLSVEQFRLINGKKIHVLLGCLDAEHGCKMNGFDLKPLACRLFPFTMRSLAPLDERCPQGHIIAGDFNLVEKILCVRERLGYKDDDGVWWKKLIEYRK